MASKIGAAAAEAAAKAGPNFRVGEKQVFLPNHVIKMLPPKRIVSPYFATFQVPLRFNKLDLRDYLYHAYGVEVRSVRSWLTPQQPRRRYQNEGVDSSELHTKDLVNLGRGAWYRPQPIKRMMVELVQPFAYPEPPPEPTASQRGTDEDARKDWDYDLHARLRAQQTLLEANQRRMAHDKTFRMRIEEEHVPAFRVGLAKQARELVAGDKTWRNSVDLDERWAAIEAAEAKEEGGGKTGGSRS